MRIPFNRPYVAGSALAYIQQAVENMHLSGNGPFTQKCQTWLENRIGCKRALLTPSGTAALEMAALLTDVGPGDEIIVPSFTFASTATAFVLRGAVPVFVDIRPDTLCIDESEVEKAITAKTKAIVVVHYAGVGCEFDAISSFAQQRDLHVIEDAAHGVCSRYKGRPLGGLGTLAALSFHETKNVMAGEAGTLLINDARWAGRAEILQEKGTNRREFLRGDVDEYSWIDIGSSYSASEITAAFLWAQLEDADTITERRLSLWRQYHDSFADLEQQGYVRRPIIPSDHQHNGHLYYLLFPDRSTRTSVSEHLNRAGVSSAPHYVPLHSSVAGRRYGRAVGTLPHTEAAGERLLRLPLWVGMSADDIARVRSAVGDAIAQAGPRLPGF